jgi:uncharacterized membrane protein YbhN (UPF0104 family)
VWLMSDAAASAPSPPDRATQPARTRPSRRQVILRILLLVGILVFVFVVVLPRVVDFQAVGAALAKLTAGQLVVLAAATIVAYVASSAPAKVLLPELSWPHAVGADLAGRAVASTIPGPTDLAIRFVLYRQWAIPADRASAGIVFAGLFEPLSSLVLPLIATIGVIVTGHVTEPRVFLVAAIGLVVLVIAAALIVGVVRSESLARRIGNGLDWLARHLWTLFRRTPPAGIVEGVLDFRERAKDILAGHGFLAFVAAVVAKLAWFLVLELSLVAVGVTPDLLPASVVLAAMAVVGIVALIPITPGGVGVFEVAYIGILSAVAGPGYTEQITAGVMLFRIAQWGAVIPIGWVLLLVMRGGHLTELLGDDNETLPPADGQEAPATTT